MDIVAHGLWAGAGAHWLARRGYVDARTSWGIVALAVAPDVVPMLPVVVHAVTTSNGWGLMTAWAAATPSAEPALPATVASWAHHLHCTWHSLVVLAAITAMAWSATLRFPMVLLGAWSHALIDIPTHSADYYAARPLYPLSEWAFDGVAWNGPWMLAATYVSLLLVYAALLRGPPAATR